MLVDSSVWIDFLRGTELPQTQFLKQCLATGKAVWLAPPILQEVLQGAGSLERFSKWNRVLGGLPLIEVSNVRALSVEAAKIYATCRWNAFTPRSANDCLIAAYAVHASMLLLHNDRDFSRIATLELRLRLIELRK
jgi:predicted nucleic acid-binding protein